MNSTWWRREDQTVVRTDIQFKLKKTLSLGSSEEPTSSGLAHLWHDLFFSRKLSKLYSMTSGFQLGGERGETWREETPPDSTCFHVRRWSRCSWFLLTGSGSLSRPVRSWVCASWPQPWGGAGWWARSGRPGCGKSAGSGSCGSRGNTGSAGSERPAAGRGHITYSTSKKLHTLVLFLFFSLIYWYIYSGKLFSVYK